MPYSPSKTKLQALKKQMISRHKALLNNSGPSATEWKPVRNSNGIRSFIHYPANKSIPIVRAESIIHCEAEALFRYLVTDIAETCKEWNDVMYFSEVIKRFEEENAELARVISEGKMVADREDVFLRFMGNFENGAFYEVSKGLGKEEIPIKKTFTKYIVRSKLIFCSKEITPLKDGKCKYETIWHYDPAGWLSKLIPLKRLAGMILKNLEHEHEKLAEIFPKEKEPSIIISASHSA